MSVCVCLLLGIFLLALGFLVGLLLLALGLFLPGLLRLGLCLLLSLLLFGLRLLGRRLLVLCKGGLDFALKSLGVLELFRLCSNFGEQLFFELRES